jgi:4'-phosphopantetheinyl transferase
MDLIWPEKAAPPSLSADEAHVWAIPIDEQHALGEDALATLSDDERWRANQFRLDALRRRFVTARAALRRLLGEYLGVPAAEVILSSSKYGKPQLGETNGDGALRFNLAHTRSMALVAVARGCELGVDVERVREVNQLEAIVRRYFHLEEQTHLFATPIERRHEEFLRCWTAKEAVLKAMGSGLSDSLAEFCVLVPDSSKAWVDVRPHGSLASQRCWVRHLTPCEDAIAAVAFVGENRRVQCFTLND